MSLKKIAHLLGGFVLMALVGVFAMIGLFELDALFFQFVPVNPEGAGCAGYPVEGAWQSNIVVIISLIPAVLVHHIWCNKVKICSMR
jgi:hypothetical protein